MACQGQRENPDFFFIADQFSPKLRQTAIVIVCIDLAGRSPAKIVYDERMLFDFQLLTNIM
jgi:hypothetical protein